MLAPVENSMRIVLLSDRIPPEQLGGAEKVTWTLALGLARAGHDVHVIAGTARGERSEQNTGVTIHYVYAQTPYKLRGWLSMLNYGVVRRVNRLFTNLQPDVVNAHNIHNQLSFACLLAAQWRGIPTVFTAHDFMSFTYGKLSQGIDPLRDNVPSPVDHRLPPLHNLRLMRWRFNPFRTLFIRNVLRHTGVRTCVSRAHRDALQANLNLSFEVVYNGSDPAPYLASSAILDLSARLRERWSVGTRPVVLFSGRFGKEKGSIQLLSAMHEVVKAVPNVLLVILSAISTQQIDEYQRDEFRSLWDNNVITGGWLDGDELIAAYHVADVVTVPSVYVDPMVMVNLDAMASSKPIVGTCFGGTPEVVKDGETGLIVNPFDTVRYAEALIRLLRDPDLRQRMGTAGQQRLTEQFTLKTQVQNMLTLYQRVVSSATK
jgi:glycosyltransferase involved in cell wall biosynthesis